MRRRMKPLPQLGPEQAKAADPQAHAALSASAGSGKTQVLTARVLRLLLGGVRPDSILCLTFTKAAAAEMANRVGARLASWVRLKDSELATDLLHLGERNDPATRQRARRLFARVLDAPGGLKIQTIHSFAQTLLASFPAEAGIAPGFTPIEPRAEQELARTTLARLIADAETAGDEGLTADVQCLSRRLGEQGAVDYLMICASRHEALAALGPAQGIEARLRDLMNLPAGDVDDYLSLHCADDGFDCDLLRAIAEANRSWGTSTGAGHVERIESWLALPAAERARKLPDLALVVFTGKEEPRKITKGQTQADAQYQRHVDEISVAIRDLLTVQRGAQLASAMAAGLRAGQRFAEAYTRAKRVAGVADFDDLIAWTRRLLANPGMGDWVRYKLDRDVDHILVDEAQDTNASQWEIIHRLVEEFFTGASEADHRWRTLFMVGDFKQAIYGFQGTDPREFEKIRRTTGERVRALREAEQESEDMSPASREFRDLSVSASFRSAPAILRAVDAVITELGHEAMGLPERPPRHSAFFAQLPGQVELWKPFVGPDTEDLDEGEEGWIGERVRLYADAIAREVKAWIDSGARLASTGRPISAGDVLILVRSRGELASLIVARLFAKGVPVAGVDRLHLQKPFAVRDLLAAVSFAVQPLHDLNLANLLVSPLIGWSQDQLLALAHGRKSSLWRELRDRAGERTDFGEAYAVLGGLLEMADYRTPAQFLETILSGPMDGRRKLYSRLTLAARDPIDELLSSALEFERNEIASLDRFLAWFARGDVEIQRDPSAPHNAVRVMTVHGAKGLEAPVVLLADATADPARVGRRPISLDMEIKGIGKAPLLRPAAKERMTPFTELIEEEESRNLEEHWRLLYVGMTRAAERLVISGIEPKHGRSDDCWHVRVERALAAIGAAPLDDPVWSRRLLFRGEGRMPPASRSKERTEPPPVAIPAWANMPAPPEARPPRPLAPSAMAQDREPAPPPAAEQRSAAERGIWIHQLIERLADAEPDGRRELALRWLERSAGVADENRRREITSIVCAILEDPEFAPLFGPGSLGEAPLAATLDDGRVIAGTVDRLLVEEDRILVVDFKTGRVPDTEAQIPASHRAQMEAYALALRTIFPGREIRAGLLYTGGPQLFTA